MIMLIILGIVFRFMGSCSHLAGVREDVEPRSSGCEECEREGLRWTALRLCLTCGHVGCCDTSPGRHARKHFEETGHPIIVPLPKRDWRWCYIDNKYV